MNKILFLLECIGRGDTNVIMDESGNYTRELLPVKENCEVRSIKSRLQYELYGEFPLSENNRNHWFLFTQHAITDNL